VSIMRQRSAVCIHWHPVAICRLATRLMVIVLIVTPPPPLLLLLLLPVLREQLSVGVSPSICLSLSLSVCFRVGLPLPVNRRHHRYQIISQSRCSGPKRWLHVGQYVRSFNYVQFCPIHAADCAFVSGRDVRIESSSISGVARIWRWGHRGSSYSWLSGSLFVYTQK